MGRKYSASSPTPLNDSSIILAILFIIFAIFILYFQKSETDTSAFDSNFRRQKFDDDLNVEACDNFEVSSGCGFRTSALIGQSVYQYLDIYLKEFLVADLANPACSKLPVD